MTLRDKLLDILEKYETNIGLRNFDPWDNLIIVTKEKLLEELLIALEEK